MMTNPDDKTRRTASALRSHMLKTMRELLKTPREIKKVHGKGVRTKFGSVLSGRLFLVRDEGRFWISDGCILLGPVPTTQSVLDSFEHREVGPSYKEITGIDADLEDVSLVETRRFEEPKAMAVHMFGASEFGLDSVYLELALQWLDVGEGRNRKRNRDPHDLTVQQGSDPRDPFVLCSSTGRVAIISPCRLPWQGKG